MYSVGDKVLMTVRDDAFVAEVTRITPKGFIVAKVFGHRYEHIFKPDGWERTSNKYWPRRISPLTDEDERLIKMKEARKEARAVFELIRNVLTKEQCETIISWKEVAGV